MPCQSTKHSLTSETVRLSGQMQPTNGIGLWDWNLPQKEEIRESFEPFSQMASVARCFSMVVYQKTDAITRNTTFEKMAANRPSIRGKTKLEQQSVYRNMHCNGLQRGDKSCRLIPMGCNTAGSI